ncbi:MAG: hypothetical protein DCC43_07815 [Candidatus Brocadia sp.]|nr:hypothetical protein [Candidatus Brocadia fulgida]MCC6326133.1 glycosyltransferase [Candidatus Brocadia sp.]MCE7912006.1 glycosyltransferase [Candidatus Brocadia sp. AMX3]MDG5995490.1 glycosyltransferase [Candidatus Brocadia sp.]RIJ99830.1 MAG: hypothetical protein DCC43_07815 [Candidatus Brocadia sp.]
MKVSIIIPAYNAAGTLAETLESVRAQTLSGWEAIVIDDGSTDTTAAIAANFAEKDPRIRIVSQPKGGVSAARNTGIANARYDWLLFLDADDWLLPLHLEKITHVLIADATLDAVHCGWANIAPDGTHLDAGFCFQLGDLFGEFANRCAFPIHACVVRKSVVDSIGGYDSSLITCEDWDLWQRIARTGASFGTIQEVLSLYRTRPGSASRNSFQLLADGILVIERGHAPDARVPNPRPEHANGQPVAEVPAAILEQLCWCAGIFLGVGKDARPLLGAVRNIRDALVYGNARNIADYILISLSIHGGQPLAACYKIWHGIEQRVDEFLLAIEEQSQTFDLANRIGTVLKRLILAPPATPRPLTIGNLHAIRVEVTEPINDIVPSIQVNRLICSIELEGTHIGTIELPVCDGIVPGHVLADAIAADFSWVIFKRYFECTVRPNLSMKRNQLGFSIWRKNLCLVEAIPGNEHTVEQQLYEKVGWTVFLQEVFGCQNLPLDGFYQTKLEIPSIKHGWKSLIKKFCARHMKSHERISKRKVKPLHSVPGNWLMVEIAERLSDVEVSGKELNIVLTVGGVVLNVIIIPVIGNIVHRKELRVAIATTCGLELCRAAVREGLLGRPITDKPLSLQKRLEAKSLVMQRHGDSSLLKGDTDIVFVPGSARALDNFLSFDNRSLILGRHACGRIGTSASRRAMLPAATTPELIDASRVAGEPVIQIPAPGEQPRHVAYVPELVWFPSPDNRTSVPESRVLEKTHSAASHTQNQIIITGNVVTDRLPILMYHRVALTAKPSGDRYRITPESFEEQLSYLRNAGYYSINLEDWHNAMEKNEPLPGRAVMITFDDGYLDFLTCAWPLLRKYGFFATVFIVADLVGKTNKWDEIYGEEIPLMGWKDIRRLQDDGVLFGSHSASHPYLTVLPPEQIVREGARSRAILGRELGITVPAFAYPYGDVDPVVQHLIGACGYLYGLSCREDLSTYRDPLLALPRIEVSGADSLQHFITKLGVLQSPDTNATN